MSFLSLSFLFSVNLLNFNSRPQLLSHLCISGGSPSGLWHLFFLYTTGFHLFLSCVWFLHLYSQERLACSCCISYKILVRFWYQCAVLIQWVWKYFLIFFSSERHVKLVLFVPQRFCGNHDKTQAGSFPEKEIANLISLIDTILFRFIFFSCMIFFPSFFPPSFPSCFPSFLPPSLYSLCCLENTFFTYIYL